MDIIKSIYEKAKKIGACDKLQYTEDINQLAELLFSCHGVNFCLWNSFPSIKDWEEIAKHIDLQQYGIYLNAGNINLTNPKRAILIGNTYGVVYADQANYSIKLIAYQGAGATPILLNGAVMEYLTDNKEEKPKAQNGVLIQQYYDPINKN